MTSPFDQFANLGPMTALGTLGAFAILLILFAWRIPSFVKGLGTLIATWFIAPFVYLRKLARKLGTFGDLGDGAYKETDQFLLRRVIHACETALLLLASLLLAATLAISVGQLIPPIEARQQLRSVRADLAAAQAEVEPTSADLAKLDADWTTNRKKYIEGVKADDAKRIAAAEASLQSIETRIESNSSISNAPTVLRRIVAQGMAAEGASVTDVKAETKAGIRRQVAAPLAAEIEPWVDAWGRLAEAQMAAAQSSEEQVRARTQSNWGALSSKKKNLDERIQSLRKDEASKAETASPQPGLAFRAFSIGLGMFLFGVWILGLALESLSLAVNVAGDIRTLRTTLAPESALEAGRGAVPFGLASSSASLLHLEPETSA